MTEQQTSFDRARARRGRPVNEAGECPKCFDPDSGTNSGCWAYDENHATVCDLCCPHDQGFWLLERHYGDHNGRYCCKGGCGHTISAEEYLTYLQPPALQRAARARGRRNRLSQ